MNSKNKIIIAALAAVVLLGGVATRVATAEDAPVRDSIAEKVVVYCANHPSEACDSAVNIVSQYLLDGGTVETLGAAAIRNQGQTTTFTQVGLLDGDSPPDSVLRSGYEKFPVMSTATTTATSWCNKTPEDVWVKRAFGRVYTTSTSGLNATVALSMGTSTANAVAYNLTTEPCGLICKQIMSTGTAPIIDSGYGSGLSAYPTSDAGVNATAATGTSKLFLIRPNECLVSHIRAIDARFAVTSTGSTGMSDKSYTAIEWVSMSTSTPF